MALSPDDERFMGTFFRSLKEGPLDYGDERYVPIYSRTDLEMDDPVQQLGRGIRLGGTASTQLFSGFRGTGKSTELRRLQHDLRASGYVVVLANIDDYLNTSVPIDVSDFLMFLAGAFGDGLAADASLGGLQVGDGFWARLGALITRLRIEEATFSLEAEPEAAGTKFGKVGAEVKVGLKEDNTLRARMQRAFAGHVSALVKEVREFIRAGVRSVRAERGRETEVVLLVDSIEHIRGNSISAPEVAASLENLFVDHADKLRLPDLHVVCTVPPWLKVRRAKLGDLYDGFPMLPAIRVHTKSEGAPFAPGLQAIEAVVAKRGDWQRLLGPYARLEAIMRKSGGHLRDVFYILMEVIRRLDTLPASEHAVSSALAHVKNDMLPIADEHAVWMAQIIRTQRASLELASQLPDLARFLDTVQVLGYRNGDEWYDVHPLIADDVIAQVADLIKRRVAAGA